MKPTQGSNFLGELEKIKRTMIYVDEFIDNCSKCGSDNLSTVRVSMRGTGKDDKNGLYCEKCRLMYLLR